MAASWLPGWTKRVKLSIDSGDITAVLSHFPVLIHLSANCGRNGEDLTFVFDEVGANSLKIAVTKSDGTTELYVEIEKWDNGAEEAWLHASLAGWTIASDVDTELYLYFDNTHADNNARVGVTNSVVAESVWDADFQLVCHMRDNPDNANVRDSTAKDNDGAKTGANEPAINAAGKIDGSQTFDNEDDDGINCGADPTLDFSTIDFTLECCAKTSAAVNSTRLINKRVEGAIGFAWLLANVTGLQVIGVQDAGGWNSASSNTRVNDGVDRCLAVSIDRSANAAFYLNGAPDGGGDISGGAGDIDTVSPLTLGYGIGSAGVTYFEGDMDEVRVSTGLRSAAWLKATYETLWDDLLDFGSEEIIDFEDLSAEFFVVRARAGELFAEFVVDDTHTITGITKDNAGARLGNCEVALFRVEAGVPPTYTFIEAGVSDGNGDYTFTGLTKRRFFVRAQKDGSPNVFDTTDNELEPV